MREIIVLFCLVMAGALLFQVSIRGISKDDVGFIGSSFYFILFWVSSVLFIVGSFLLIKFLYFYI